MFSDYQRFYFIYMNLITCYSQYKKQKFVDFSIHLQIIFFYFSAYYRVNYDNTLWSRIRQILHENHTIVDVLNRAQIVDDSCNLALAQEITFTDALGILEYLRHETDYYPWYTAITCFTKLVTRFGETSEIGSRLNTLQLDLIQNIYKSVSFTNLNESDQIYTLKLSSILLRACKLGEQTCVNSSRSLFQASKNNSR